MKSRWAVFVMLFSVAVNFAAVGTLLYFWHTNNQNMEIRIGKFGDDDNADFMWFNEPDKPSPVSGQIDSLREIYHQQLAAFEEDIDSTRQQIVYILLSEPIDRAQLDSMLNRLALQQTRVERLTVDHLIDIKPLLPEDEWKLFLNELKPRHLIKTKIIKLGDDSKGLFMNESKVHIIKDMDSEIVIERKSFNSK